MYTYEGIAVRLDSATFHAVILKVNSDEPGHDTLMERECRSREEANIWIDDEISKLTSGRGVWDL